jgi:hypothetical protein
MAKDYIRYDLLAQDALRGVVRKVLHTAAQQGLPGEHHFYISIATTVPGVMLSPRLHEQYPDEMTIILQHQFWDLEIDDNEFSVTLSTESDTFGPIEVDATKYWGAQAQRSLGNFKIGWETQPAPIVRALGIVKRAAAETNMDLGKMDAELGKVIVRGRAGSDRRQAR